MKLEYQLIKPQNNCCNSVEQLENLLKTNNCFKVNKELEIIEFKNKTIKYKINKFDTTDGKEVIFIVKFETLKSNINLEEITFFESFDQEFINTINLYKSEKNYIYINTLEDEISKYYSERLYPKFNKIENKLRKIIYIFMENNLGSLWMEKSIGPNLKEKLDKSFQDRHIKDNQNDYLINTDFIVLGKFLFEEYTTGKFEDIESKIKKLEGIDESQLRSEIKKIQEDYTKKSNYNRYFDGKLENDNLKKKWESLYNYRCLVAHNKRIRKKEFETSNKLIEDLDKVFEKCLTNIDNVKVPKENIDTLEKIGIISFSEVNEPLNYTGEFPMNSYFNEIKDYYYIFKPITDYLEITRAKFENANSIKTIFETYNDSTKRLKCINGMNAFELIRNNDYSFKDWKRVYDKQNAFEIASKITKPSLEKKKYKKRNKDENK